MIADIRLKVVSSESDDPLDGLVWYVNGQPKANVVLEAGYVVEVKSFERSFPKILWKRIDIIGLK